MTQTHMTRTSHKHPRRAALLIPALLGLAVTGVTPSGAHSGPPGVNRPLMPGFVTVPIPTVTLPGGGQSRGEQTGRNLAPELRDLQRQYDGSRGGGPRPYSDAQLLTRFGIRAGTPDPVVGVAVTLAPGASPQALAADGVTAFFRQGRVVYGAVRARALDRLAGDPAAAHVAPTEAAQAPAPPAQNPSLRGLSRGATLLPMAFDHRGMTGKGVIVGVVDSGIDWRHADFRRADGSTRILAVWDMTDDSYTSSGGRVGSRPPVSIGGKPLGTLYTRAQINAALRGAGTVNTGDTEGHGTACAGVAAGGGLAPGHFPGVAPQADLLIVRAGADSHIGGLYYLGTRWIVRTAKARHEPCVVSQSFGSQGSAHNGASPEERVMDALAGPGRGGVAVCVAAGNEGQDSLHAGGRFGPRRPGQADVAGQPTDLYVTRETELDGYFGHGDDWGLIVVNLDNRVVDASGQPVPFAFVVDPGHGGVTQKVSRDAVDPSAVASCLAAPPEMAVQGADDRLALRLSPGRYQILGFGTGPRVPGGAYDLYLPFPDDATFGQGADRRYMVATPGNADNVLTVGAYIARDAWPSRSGRVTAYNLVLGDIAPYSSPGFRRGGRVKPDLCAPGTFALSPLSPGSALGKNGDGSADTDDTTPDGQHLAWQGTSAATPYVAGVVALMLQKDPRLDESQIQRILTRTARHDDFTGAVPNPQWGYGKLDPGAALRAVP